jgi:L-lactate dehydrogenase complex protein LldF
MAKTYIGLPRPFPEAARDALQDSQMRTNLARATATIRVKRAGVVAEVPDWELLRQAGHDIKMSTLSHLDDYLLAFEHEFVNSGGIVHWAKDGKEATDIVVRIALSHHVSEVVKVKSLTTDEIGLNEALSAVGINAQETDLAELIVQLADEHPSHILVPAIHKNRTQIRDLFVANLPESPPGLSDEPRELAMVAREHLRRKFLSATMAVSGANFAVAESGTLVVVESEGNGRMCLTLPEVLVSVVGIEKIIPTWRDLEVFLQLLPRSSTGERMNPYTSFWTGNADGDGPSERHVILLDNGRIQTLRDEVGREALACIRCSACMNVCPVYERTGGHAYGSVYPGPIGAIITPQLLGPGQADTLPFASTLCGACVDVCPVKIDIPKILVHLRARAVATKGATGELFLMRALARVLRDGKSLERAQRFLSLSHTVINSIARLHLLRHLPGPSRGWLTSRDAPIIPRKSARLAAQERIR